MDKKRVVIQSPQGRGLGRGQPKAKSSGTPQGRGGGRGRSRGRGRQDPKKPLFKTQRGTMRIPRRPNPQAKELNTDFTDPGDYDPNADFGEEDQDPYGGEDEEEDDGEGYGEEEGE